jgi:hypothetical protein
MPSQTSEPNARSEFANIHHHAALQGLARGECHEKTPRTIAQRDQRAFFPANARDYVSCLRDKKLIPLKVGRLERLREVAILGVTIQASLRKTDHHLASGADNLEATRGRTLHVVLMQVHWNHPIVDSKLQDGAGNVFDIQLQVAQLTASRKHACRYAKEPVQVV